MIDAEGRHVDVLVESLLKAWQFLKERKPQWVDHLM